VRIIVDPSELGIASETLRGCAVEAADIGSQLWSCAGCAMPPDIQQVVEQIVVASDRALDSVGEQLSGYSTDLANRAQIATTDSLTAAVAASTGTAVSSASGGVGSFIIGGTPLNDFQIIAPDGSPVSTSPSTTTMIIGGTPLNDFQVIGPDGVPISTSPSTATMTIGGNPPNDIQIIGPDGVPVAPAGWTTMIIGAPDYSQGPMSGVMALAEASDNIRRRAQARIDAIAANPNSSAAAIRIAMNAQNAMSDGLLHQLAPSRSELEARHGPLTDGEIRSMSPHTLPTFTNIFAGVV
jgi:hypothetical protein